MSQKNYGLLGGLGAAPDLGVRGEGDMLGQQVQEETEEQRRRRLLLEQMQQASSNMGAANSLNLVSPVGSRQLGRRI
jgi:hypothetical protein